MPSPSRARLPDAATAIAAPGGAAVRGVVAVGLGVIGFGMVLQRLAQVGAAWLLGVRLAWALAPWRGADDAAARFLAAGAPWGTESRAFRAALRIGPWLAARGWLTVPVIAALDGATATHPMLRLGVLAARGTRDLPAVLACWRPAGDDVNLLSLAAREGCTPFWRDRWAWLAAADPTQAERVLRHTPALLQPPTHAALLAALSHPSGWVREQGLLAGVVARDT